MNMNIFKALLILVCFTNVVYSQTNGNITRKLVLTEMIKQVNLNGGQKSYFSHELQMLKNNEPYRGPTGTAVINGTILDTSAIAVANHYVFLYKIMSGDWTSVDIIKTNASGEYSFTGLAAAVYVVRIGNVDDDYLDYIWQDVANGGPQLCNSCDIPNTSYFNLADAEVKNNVDFNIALGGVIKGNLSDAISASPVVTFSVGAVNVVGANLYHLRGNVDPVTGDYAIKGIPDGSYRIYLEPDYYMTPNLHIPQVFGGPECNDCYRLIDSGIGSVLTIASANTLNNKNFLLKTGASINGKVVDAISLNPLLETSFIMVFDELNTWLALFYMDGTNIEPTADGKFTIGGLLPGSYYVQGGDLGHEMYQREMFANKPCYWSGCNRGTDGDSIVLSAKENRLGVGFLLEVGGKISGKVIDGVTGLPAELPVGNSLYVSFYDASNAVVGGAYVQSDGTYVSARGLPAGSYAVRTGSMFVGELSQPYVNEKYNNIPCAGLACNLTTADVAVAVGAITTNIDFALSEGYSFSGTITDTSTAMPIPGVNVLVYKDMGVGMEPKFANWATTSDGTNSVKGSFSVSGLPAGTYYAVTNNGSNLPFPGLIPKSGAGWVDILYSNMPCPAAGCDISTGTPIILPVVVRAGETVPTVDFDLIQGAKISGRVINYNDSASIKEIQINVFNEFGESMGVFTTNDHGEYQTAGFPAGTYYLTTASFDVLVDVKFGDESCMIDHCDPLDAIPITLFEQEHKSNQNFKLKPDFIFGNNLD